MIRHPKHIARAILPHTIAETIAPTYRMSRRLYYRLEQLTNRNIATFTYDGSVFHVRYTPETAIRIRSLVEDGQMRAEKVPLEYLDSATNPDIILDIGAHVGIYSVALNALNPDTPVYAFEPDSYNRSVLDGVFRANNIPGGVRHEVVTNESGEVTFYIDTTEGSQSHSTTKLPGFEPQTKECIRISEFLQSHDVDRAYLKIDVEGGEDAILEDLATLSLEYIEGLIEFHPEKLDGDITDLLSVFDDLVTESTFIGDSSPDHPDGASIDYEANRPIYYFNI